MAQAADTFGAEGAFLDADWSGAEIKACCRLAALLDVPLVEAAQNVVPVARTAHESVQRLRAWASGRCLAADQPGIYTGKLVPNPIGDARYEHIARRHQHPHYPARSEAHFRRLFAVIREYLDALDAGRFNFRPTWGCSMCEFTDSHCREWSG